jgi:hypothetical protein
MENRIFEELEPFRPHITPTRIKGEWRLCSQNVTADKRINRWMPDPVGPVLTHSFDQVCHRAKDVFKDRLEQLCPIERRHI